MEMYESFSRALLRRKYRRIEAGGGGFVVKRKRVKVAHLQQDVDVAQRRRSTAHRLKLRCFHLRFLVPERLVASLKATCGKLMQQVANSKGKPAIEHTPNPVLMLPKNMPLRSSNNDVINEVWFQQALRRSIAEGRLTI
ncbi:hypothetical protein KC19_1G233400 [Ceratodon purpureus]|uniref:Uncharacterized protein n=1 Tax=Ceratodon purpureus TaxID=3225 RepID=A0A8T0J8G6_CERPU|nr:hypothetical protein KC19_1G233400 [Ceratodon purpureus]